MALKKLDLAVGVKIRGYGIMNEYGEFEFTPEETGKHAGRIKLVKRDDNWSIHESERFLFFRMRIAKSGGRLKILTNLFYEMDNIIHSIKKYDF